jgi:hypothetical protein
VRASDVREFFSEPGFYAHEWLHTFSVDHQDIGHARNELSADYQDTWDIMSYRAVNFVYDGPQGLLGPEMSALYRHALGILPDYRVWTMPEGAGTWEVQLVPLTNARTLGTLAVHVEGTDVHPPLWIEFRKPNMGFDGPNVPEGVVVHEQRWDTDGFHTYLLNTPTGGSGDPLTAGETLVVGDLTITVNSLTSATGDPEASLTLAYTPTPRTFSNATNVGVKSGSSPAVTSWGGDRLDAFYVGSSLLAPPGSSHLYHIWSDDAGQHWSAPESHGFDFISAPAATSWGYGRLDVFARGTDDALYQRTFDNTISNQWLPLRRAALGGPTDGTFQGDPAIATWGKGQLHVFVIGNDGAIWRAATDDGGNTWGAWESLGGSFVGGPAAISWQPHCSSPNVDPPYCSHRLDVFGIDYQDGNLLHKAFDQTDAWSEWENLGGNFLDSAPSVSSWRAGHLHVFARGTDDRFYELSYSVDNWAGFVRVGSPTSAARIGSPAAVSTAEHTIHVFGLDTSGNIQQQEYLP